MNTKSAVILMIGLLGMPAVFNFTKQMDSPGPRWSVVPVSGNRPLGSAPGLGTGDGPAWGILLDNRTGQVRFLSSDYNGSNPEGKFFTNERVFMSPPATPNP